MNTETIITQLRDRARAYETGSPQREAYHVAMIRYEYAEDDERIDKAIMHSWAIQEQRGTLIGRTQGKDWKSLAERLHNTALVIDKQTSKADAQTRA